MKYVSLRQLPLPLLTLAALLIASLSSGRTPIVITPSAQTLSVGQQVDLNASEPLATWTSSNTAVATVTITGLVTARAAGTATITAKYRSDRGTALITVQAVSTPFLVTPVSLPGIVQAEDFDNGGEGVAYHDTTAGNAGGAYRTTVNVDLAPMSSDGNGYHVGWFAAGEWLAYSVTVPTAGTYAFGLRFANAGSGATGHLEVDGADVTGGYTFPSTGAWSVWQTLTRSVQLSAGRHLLRLVMDTGNTGSANGADVNWMQFTTATVPPTCFYSAMPATLSYPSGGGVQTIQVTTSTGCAWTVTPSQSWMLVTPTGATGSGTVSVTVQPNPSVLRSGQITIAGQVVSVTQAATPPMALLCDDLTTQKFATVARGSRTLMTCKAGPAPSGFKVVVTMLVSPWTSTVTDVGHLTAAGLTSASGMTPYFVPLWLPSAGLFDVSSIAYGYDATGGLLQTASTPESTITVTVQ